MKLKALLPTLREKKRYLLFETFGEGETSQREANEALMSELHRFLGEFGMAKAGVVLLKDWNRNRGILRTVHNQVDTVKSAVLLAKGKDFAFKTLVVSGSLGKVRKRLMEA